MASWAYVSGIQTAKLLQEGEIGLLGRGAIINSATNNAISIYGGVGDRADLMIAGQALSSEHSAVSINFASLHLSIASTGLLMGLAGIAGSVSSTIWASTAGDIMGEFAGVTLDISSLTGFGRVSNSGRISGGTIGVNLDVRNSAKASVVINSGEIEGGVIGIAKNYTAGSQAAGSMKIINSGDVAGGSAAIFLGIGVDTVINSGLIDGLVSLGGGNDSVNNRFGEIRGAIQAGAGLDSFRPGRFEDRFEGGADVDTLDLRAAGGVTVDLRNILENTGVAEGDTYIDVENVLGSGAADVIRGTAVANTLRGMGGKDNLHGDGGDDVLMGGAGRDTLTGGAGSDRFLFLTLSELGDTITDFGDAAGNEDVLRLSASGLGGGLTAGAVAASKFVTRATDHIAQDAADRFILNKADKTLWFDADGSGAAEAVLVVDLQNSTTFGVGDMVLI